MKLFERLKRLRVKKRLFLSSPMNMHRSWKANRSLYCSDGRAYFAPFRFRFRCARDGVDARKSAGSGRAMGKIRRQNERLSRTFFPFEPKRWKFSAWKRLGNQREKDAWAGGAHESRPKSASNSWHWVRIFLFQLVDDFKFWWTTGHNWGETA